jgi:hypothetical protein
MANVEQKKNIETLIRGVVVGQNKGAFTLKDAATLHTVITDFASESPKTKEQDIINALIQGVAIAQKAGAFSLEDANTIFEAVKLLEQKPEQSKVEEPKIKEI